MDLDLCIKRVPKWFDKSAIKKNKDAKIKVSLHKKIYCRTKPSQNCAIFNKGRTYLLCRLYVVTPSYHFEFPTLYRNHFCRCLFLLEKVKHNSGYFPSPYEWTDEKFTTYGRACNNNGYQFSLRMFLHSTYCMVISLLQQKCTALNLQNKIWSFHTHSVKNLILENWCLKLNTIKWTFLWLGKTSMTSG